MLNDEQTSLIQKISEENGFKHFSISVEIGSKKGDNYLGNIFLVTVKENDAKKEIRYILKCAETNSIVREQMPINEAYKREVYIYNNVLPAFKSFQGRYHPKHPFTAFAKIYGYSTEEGKEFLLMENIRDLNFHMLDRKKTMDDEHVTLVFQELARFHSLSLAMKHLEPETYKSLVKNLEDYFEDRSDIKKAFMNKLPHRIQIALKLAEDHQKATEVLLKYTENFEIILKKMKDEENKLVIIHGDPWCNNMMFKYEDSSNQSLPTSMCFLDWQISKIQSPIIDLYYFLLLSASRPILVEHKKYLKLYYKIVDENLKSVGCNTESIFSYESFQDHLVKLAPFGLLIALSNLELLLQNEEDAKSFVDMAETGNNVFDVIFSENNKKELSDEYRQRMKDIIFFLVDNNYLSSVIY